MAENVLVAYGSRYGATAEIAEKIGDVIRQEGIAADVLPAGRAGDISRYGAFIIGSAAYVGQWRKDAVNLVARNEKLLSAHPVWIFSSGPTGEGDPVELVQGWRYPKKLAPVIERIKPRDIAVFHGAAYAEKLNPLFKYMLNMVKAPVGDFRDWEMIESWAKKIAGELT
jgi:menaquinone-dependent protoporphyrinogen oxidase